MKMINKISFYLIGLLFIQVALIGYGYWASSSAYNQREVVKLIPLGTENKSVGVDKIIISNSSGDSATLVKVGDQWQLPELKNLAVDATKITTTLDKLKSVKLTWPVATTESSHTRFKVAKDDFVQRVKLFTGETVVREFFLGNSPGLKKIHARLNQEEEVYAIKLHASDILENDIGWLDKSLISAKDVKQISTEEHSFSVKDGVWKLVEKEALARLIDGIMPKLPITDDVSKQDNLSAIQIAQNDSQTKVIKTANVENIDALSRALSSLKIIAVAELTAWQPEKNIEIIANSGDKWKYELAKKDDKYYIRRVDIDAIFEVNDTIYSSLLKELINSRPS